MINRALAENFTQLSTPLIADAALRLKVQLRIAPAGIHPIISGIRLTGRALPVKHFGSVDVFLEAMMSADAGDVLVIDNNGRRDEGCIGDLTALEAKANKLAGIVVWGASRHAGATSNQFADFQLRLAPIRSATARSAY